MPQKHWVLTTPLTPDSGLFVPGQAAGFRFQVCTMGAVSSPGHGTGRGAMGQSSSLGSSSPR